MKNFIRKMAEKLNSLPFNKKIKCILVAGSLLISGFLMVLASVFSVRMMTGRFQDLTNANIKTASEGVENLVEQYGESLKSIIPDEGIQDYLKSRKGSTEYEAAVETGRETLKMVSMMKEDVNFIALYREPSIYLYRGTAINKSHFVEKYEENLKKSISWKNSDLKISYGNTYFGGDHFTLSVYQPVYDMDRIGKKIGVLCVNIEGSALDILKDSMIENSTLQMYMTDRNGVIVFSGNKQKNGKKIEISMEGDHGTVSRRNVFWTFQEIGDSGLYVVGKISNGDLIRYSFLSFSILFLAMMVIIVVMLLLSAWGVSKTYEPMRVLVQYMDEVSEGNLKIRIEEDGFGEDFTKVGRGFNHMLISMEDLMKKIKLEQQQNTQIQLNALQEQIKPHFLYNALDCIHWQAAANGDREVSKLVKSLANYYRISLSKGRDRITLREELECARNYLVLQNLRYDNVAEFENDIEEKWMEIEIPKMTLQPLLENSIYHGLQKKNKKTKGLIMISIREIEEGVELSVADNGNGMTEDEISEMNRTITVFEEKYGYGIRNVNRRIQLLYGENYGLVYRRNGTGGVTVLIRLPGLKKNVCQQGEEDKNGS